MTISEAISQVDALKSNTYPKSDKVKWLSRLDGMVKKLIIDTHEGAEDVTFMGYDDSTDPSTELLVPAPFDEVYLRWMEAQIDYHNGEYNHYNNSIMMFNADYKAYQDFYTREHMPVSHGSRFVF